jgi:UDP-glucose 4-epimerase
MADVVVIGANGFLGSHLVDGLAADGHAVTAFDRFSAAPTFVADARILPGDFLNTGDLASAVQGQHSVFHLLSTTTPVTAERDPALDVRTNVEQTVALLRLCVDAGVQHVYFASTGGAIYGPQGKARYSELDLTLPVSPYAIGKLAIENYLRYFKAAHGLNSTVLRISNPYGARQHVQRVQGLIPIALRSIALGEPVVRYGDGSMVRDYLYVGDFVDAVRRIVRGSPANEVYNIGSGVGSSVNEVLDALRRVTGEDFAVDQRPVPATFVDRVVLDTTRYAEEFGPVSTTGIDDGVRLTFDELRETTSWPGQPS